MHSSSVVFSSKKPTNFFDLLQEFSDRALENNRTKQKETGALGSTLLIDTFYTIVYVANNDIYTALLIFVTKSL